MASILLVHDNAGPTASDVTLEGLLQTAGHTVTRRSESDPALTSGYDAVVITESGSSTSTNQWASCPMPVVVLEVGGFDGINMTSAASATNLAGGAVWDLAAHDITSGFSTPLDTGSVVYSVLLSSLPSGVTAVATADVNSSYTALFVAESGATLTSGTAPNRRACFGLSNGNVGSLTTGGQDIFVATVEWAVGSTGPNAGSASGILSFAGSATGEAPTPGQGSAGGTLSFAGTATGSRASKGSSSGMVELAGTASGSQPVDGGQASGTLSFSGTATGSRQSRGSVSGTLSLAGTATGQEASLIYRFEPPTYETEPSQQVTGGPRYKLTRSLSVVRVSGIFTEIKSPDHDTLKAAGIEGEDYFLGGRIYEVDYDTRLELEAAGYTTSRI